jgi:transitional endoplasmic reticulum ATPase
MEKMPKEKVELKVVEALQDDAYKGVARLDESIMRKLGLRRGDVISIKGDRETVAIADRSYPADIGQGIIRIDGMLRKNSKSGIGDFVEVFKADVKEAKKITIAPAQKGIMVQGDPERLRRGLLGRAMLKGDIIMLGGVQRRKDLLSDEMGDIGDMFGDIFENMGLGNLGGGITQIKFMVVNSNPNVPVIITENTEVILASKAVEIAGENVPEINYEDIGGLEDEVKKIREMVEIPMKHPEIFEKLGVEPPKGVLLHGPPGTGKTLLAKAVANESEANFILLNGPEVMSKFYGESEKKIRDIFEEAEKNAPSIVFIDEIDAIAPKREDVHGEVERRVVSQILTMMDGLKARGKVVVIGATNRVNALDPALRRPGRFDREIEVGVPSKTGRLSILKIHTRGMPLTKDVNLEKIAGLTHGFVGADLESLTKEAAMNVLRKILPNVNLDDDAEQIPQEVLEKLIVRQQDFTDALRVVRPSAMREVLIETPNVGWEDVGGLGSVKQ